MTGPGIGIGRDGATRVHRWASGSAESPHACYAQERRGLVRLEEKGGKQCEAPCHHKLEILFIQIYDWRGDEASLDEYEKVGI